MKNIFGNLTSINGKEVCDKTDNLSKIVTGIISKSLDTLRVSKPLIHCITNPISINQCANTVLAVGAKPIMAEHPLEVSEITATASALMLNLGNISDVRMESMKISADVARSKSIPVVFDAVGVACSSLRRAYSLDFIMEYSPRVIKGNYSEILALVDSDYSSEGVDSDKRIAFNTALNSAISLSQLSGSIVLASGKDDIITDGSSVIIVKNGSPLLSCITGTGCMLGALTACFLAAANSGTVGSPVDAASIFTADSPADAANTGTADSPIEIKDTDKTSAFTFDADESMAAASPTSSENVNLLFVAAACAYLGICGELAETKKGYGSFEVNLFDGLSMLDSDAISERINLEVVKI